MLPRVVPRAPQLWRRLLSRIETILDLIYHSFKMAPFIARVKDTYLDGAPWLSPWSTATRMLSTPPLMKDTKQEARADPRICIHPAGIREYTAGRRGKFSCCDICQKYWKMVTGTWIPVHPFRRPLSGKGSHHSAQEDPLKNAPAIAKVEIEMEEQDIPRRDRFQGGAGDQRRHQQWQMPVAPPDDPAIRRDRRGSVQYQT